MAQFGNIHVQFDKDSYAPGDQVNGFIYLNLFTNYPSNTVYLMISGVEETKLVEELWVTRDEYHRKYRYHGREHSYWGYSKYRKRSRARYDYWDSIGSHHRRTGAEGEQERRRILLDHYQFKPVFNHKFPVYQFGGVFIPAGQYSFPISFVLPQGMPATFNHEFKDHGSDCFADISYTMVASLDFANFGFGQVSNSQNFVVNQAIKGDGTTRAADITKQVKDCCCMDKGTVKIKAYFERSDYMSGEKAAIVAEIDNSDCKNDIDHINGVFRQYLTINAGRYSKTITNEFSKVSLTGIKSGDKCVGQDAKRLELTLTNKQGGYVQPSSSGQLIKNRYNLETTTKMTGNQCCDKAPTASILANIYNRPIER